ncbi:diuretic hormone class 2 isoform X2 [Rhynchophorus ferrugineus]|uniref:Diuretic hormone 31-like protein n=1 Tax=Rhynchophorus ferrugineus TaxID=354439 RepID=A0A5Q0TX41_RHYFE|nr:diuretic hormone 31-like protein [Rhynchophorus ferrugineus]
MKSTTSSSNTGSSLLIMVLSVLVVFEIASTFAAAYPASYSGYYSPIGFEEQNPNFINLQQAIARLRQAFIDNNDLENSKRGLDLGLGRGFSGSQAAKHLMGLAAANFAGGPGRRRRSDDEA